MGGFNVTRQAVAKTRLGRRLVSKQLVVAALFAMVATGVCIVVEPAPTADAALTNVWPASGDGEIYPDFTTTDALFVYVTSDFRGGRVCVIPDTGVGDCDAPAWGSPNIIVGIGTVFSLLQSPILQAGTWRLLTESPRPAGVKGWDRGAVSDVFTVMPCEDAGTCDSTIGTEQAQAFKAASRNVGNFTKGGVQEPAALGRPATSEVRRRGARKRPFRATGVHWFVPRPGTASARSG